MIVRELLYHKFGPCDHIGVVENCHFLHGHLLIRPQNSISRTTVCAKRVNFHTSVCAKRVNFLWIA